MADVRPFSLWSFDAEVEGRAELERLRAEIRAAEAERDRIRDDARREGFELARKDVLDAAAPMIDLLRKAAAAVEERRMEWTAATERELLKLSVAIAAKVVKAEIQSGREVAEANLRRSVELTARRLELQVLVHPDDLARIEAYLPQLRREFSEIHKIAIDAGPGVDRGGVIVQTREGSVDATIATQLDQIERGLLG